MALTNTSSGAVEHIVAVVGELRRAALESASEPLDVDLTMTQLRAVALVGLRQPISVGALAAAMGLSLASGSALFDRLVRAGHLQRRAHDSDRRQVLLELHPSSAALLRSLEDRSRRRMRRAIRAMDRRERDSLAVGLGAFLRVLREGRPLE